MEPEYLLPLSQNLATFLSCTEGAFLIRGLCFQFVTWLYFYGDELLATRPIPKLEKYPFSTVRYCLFNKFVATFHSWRPFLHPQPEEALCYGDNDNMIILPYSLPERQICINVKQEILSVSVKWKTETKYILNFIFGTVVSFDDT